MVDQPTNGTAPAVASGGAGHLVGLTGLRGVGALVVVAYHLGIGPVDGHVGVEIFFVLSGFVGMRAELRRSGGRTFAVLEFLSRRVGRILPALGVFVGVRLAFLMWFGTPVRAEEFISALTFTSNIVYINGSPPWAMVITWSLAVEMQFAIVFALIMRWSNGVLSRLRSVIIGLIVASTLWRVLLLSMGAGSVRLRYGMDTRLDQLLFGCLLALFVHRWEVTGRFRALAHPVVSAGGLAAVVFSVLVDAEMGRSYRYAFGMTIDMLAFGLIICSSALRGAGFGVKPGALRRSTVMAPLHWPWLVWIGSRSYSLYLYHALVYRLVLKWSPGRTAPKLVMVVAVSLVVAAASHRFVEQGAARLLARRTTQQTVRGSRM